MVHMSSFNIRSPEEAAWCPALASIHVQAADQFARAVAVQGALHVTGKALMLDDSLSPDQQKDTDVLSSVSQPLRYIY